MPMIRNRMLLLNIQNVVKCIKSYVRGLFSIDHSDQLCEWCLLGKHAEIIFQKKQLQEQRSL